MSLEQWHPFDPELPPQQRRTRESRGASADDRAEDGAVPATTLSGGGDVEAGPRLGALATRLRAAPWVTAIAAVARHLVKVGPPRRGDTSRFRMADGSTVTRTLDIAVHPDGSLGLGPRHEP